MVILGLIVGGIVAFYGMLFFYERYQQEEENSKQKETSNQNQTKTNNIVISLFLVICVVFLLSFTFGQAFLAGGIAGIVTWVVVNKNRSFLTSFLYKLKIFSAVDNKGIGKSVFEDLFTFSGRRNRKSYILLQLLYILIPFITLFTIDVTGVVGVVIYLFTIFCNFIVTAQRFRDTGLPGRLCLLFLLFFIFNDFLVPDDFSIYDTDFPLVFRVLIFVVWALFFVLWVALMSIPGTVGKNKYGPDPLKIHKGD